MANHEQSVIDSFNKFFDKQAADKGLEVRSFSLDGQDALAGADYIITDQSRFALIEFKYTQNEIPAESRKNKRLNLCIKLENNYGMIALHDMCHFIVWGEEEAQTMEIRCNIYRLEVCNKKIFGDEFILKKDSPLSEKRIYAKQFITEFFSGRPPRSLSLHGFEIYVKWLLQSASGSSKSSFELLTYNDTSYNCSMIKFSSVKEAYDWMQKKKPRGAPPIKPRPRKPRRGM